MQPRPLALSTNLSQRLPRVRSGYVVGSLLALFAVQAIWAIRSTSATFDETAHLPAGYSYLATGDFRMNVEHPPLAKLLAALPLRLRGDVRFSKDWQEWREADQFGFGQRFLYRENDASQLLFWGRLPIVLLGCALGALIYLWTRQLSGPTAAMFALAMFALTPDFLAHAALVTTDVPAVTFSFAAFYGLWRALCRLTLFDLTLSGAALGAALATKFNMLLFVPLFVAAPLVRACHPTALPIQLAPVAPERRLETRGSRIGVSIAAIAYLSLVALLVLWASYDFRASRFTELPELFAWTNVAPDSELIANSAAFVQSLGLVPDLYLYGLLDAFRHATARAAFLLGEYSVHGWRSYFIVSFFAKTPLPELLLMLGGCALLVRQAVRRQFAHCVLIVPVALYLAAAITAKLNIGHRHLLPIYPFLFMLAGSAAAAGVEERWSRMGVGLSFGWLAFGTASIAPSYLAYFNEAVGGPRGGLGVLVDSNLDWGQDLPGLKRWMDAHDVPRVYLSYFGTALPEYYGIDYLALPSFFALQRRLEPSLDPRRARYIAISATNLQKVYLRSSEVQAFVTLIDLLRTRSEPEAIIGHSIYVYRLNSPPR